MKKNNEIKLLKVHLGHKRNLTCISFCKRGRHLMRICLLTAIMIFFTVISVAIAQTNKLNVVGMATGSTTGTYYKFGLDITKLIDTLKLKPEIDFTIKVKDSEGSLANIKLLASKENAGFAIVQSDVLKFLVSSKKAKHRQIAKKIRLIFPFYNEEVHLFAKTNITCIEDLQGKTVILGTKNSGNWLTAYNLLYNIMNIRPGNEIHLSPPEAVEAVLEGKADAMFYVVGKPAKQFQNLDELHQKYPNLYGKFHFVPLDNSKMLDAGYVKSEISNYQWFDKTIPTVAVKAILICYDFSTQINEYYKVRCQQLGILSKAIRNNLESLKKEAEKGKNSSVHTKWEEVNLDEKIELWKLDRCSHPRSIFTTSEEPLFTEEDIRIIGEGHD
ncbi:MAG: TAXI family TRAP transporter solute-binding subunit [Desulfobacterales bacterium]|nr:TAXI family TRAP transporter solute-binding subunit [Desulfobacterales bacterium]